MERIFNSYVDSDFLKAFVVKKKEFDIEESGMELEIWRSLFKFYKEKTKLRLKLNNTTLKYMNKWDSSLIKLFLRKYLQGSDDIKVANNNEIDQISFSNFKNYNFVFISNPQTAQIISANFGIEHILSENILNDWKKYYKTNTVVVPKQKIPNSKFGWNKLSLPKHYSNSLIVCDNYLLHNKIKMENNLFFILDLFLPDSDLQIKFDLTIISSSFYNCYNESNKKYVKPTLSDIEVIYNEILNYIDIHFSLLNINLTLVSKKLSDYHDRHLYTNGFVFKSGNSFNYFDENDYPILPSETSLDIQPFVADNNEKTIAATYSPFLKSIKDILNNSKIFKGSKENRLLEKV